MSELSEKSVKSAFSCATNNPALADGSPMIDVANVRIVRDVLIDGLPIAIVGSAVLRVAKKGHLHAFKMPAADASGSFAAPSVTVNGEAVGSVHFETATFPSYGAAANKLERFVTSVNLTDPVLISAEGESIKAGKWTLLVCCKNNGEKGTLHAVKLVKGHDAKVNCINK